MDVQTPKKSRKLVEGQRTLVLGLRVNSRMDWQLAKIVRELAAEGYDTSKSEIVRYLIEDGLTKAKALFKAKNEPAKYQDETAPNHI